MVGCPLCILGYSEEEHTEEKWESLTEEELMKVQEVWKQMPGLRLKKDST